MKDGRKYAAELAGLALIVAGIFLLGAALTGGGSRAVPPERTNVFGAPGEIAILALFDSIGRTGVVGLALCLVFQGAVLAYDKKLHHAWLRGCGAITLVLALAMAEHAFAGRWGGPRDARFQDGGLIGYFLDSEAQAHMGFSGAILCIVLLLAVTIALATDVFVTGSESYFWRSSMRAMKACVAAARLLWRSALGGVRALGSLSRFGLSRLRARRRSVSEGTAMAGAPAASPPAPRRALPASAQGAARREKPAEGRESTAARRPVPVETVHGDDGEGGAGAAKMERPPLAIRDSESDRTTHKAKGSKGAGGSRRGDYVLPRLDFLKTTESRGASVSREQARKVAATIEETLQSFRIEGHVVEAQRGPVITQYEVLLAPGIKVHRISNLASELAMALKAKRIRIVAPIPGKNTVGVEVPNPQREVVCLRDLLESDTYLTSRHEIPLLLGKDGAGHPIISDLTLMPHLLIAGATGSGKSVALNSVIVTCLMTRAPEELKLILIDPKMVELSDFADIPHLLCPVVTDMRKTPATLEWLVSKMDERYEILAQAGVRNIVGFNQLGPRKITQRIKERLTPIEVEKFPLYLPYIVLVVDELADLMMTGGKDVEACIIRLAQKSRAVGIHVILATQRPSVDVITGLIKSNMPCRIAFQVSSKVDSRTILDRNGAEALLGRGDMLFLPPGASDLRRVQSCFVSDKEIRDVVAHVRAQSAPEFDEELEHGGRTGGDEGPPSERDDLYEEAVRVVLETQRGSATLLQRRFQIGYTRASRLIDMMAEEGILGPFKGSKAREVYYTLQDWEETQGQR